MKNDHRIWMGYAVLAVFLSLAPAAAQNLVEKEFDYNLKFAVGGMHRLQNGDLLMACFAYPANLDSSMALVLKTDSLLQLKWSKRIKMQHIESLSNITPLSDGNYILGGTSKPPFTTPRGGCLFKTDTAANIIWHTVYSDSYDDHVLKVFERTDQSLMVFIREGVFNYPTKVLHTDNTGNILSQRAYYSGNLALFAESVTEDGAGNYYMAGSIFNSTSGYDHVFVCSMTATALNWYKQYDLGRSVTSQGIAFLSDGTLGLTGSIVDSVFANSYDAWIMKTDLQGNIAWLKEYGQIQAYKEFLNGILPGDNGSVIALGQVNTALGFQALALKTDAVGNVVWAQSYGSFPFQTMSGGLFYPDGRMLLNAWTLNSAYLMITDAIGNSACNSTPLVLVNVPVNAAISSPSLSNTPPVITPASPPVFLTPLAISDSVLCTGTVSTGVLQANRRMNAFPVPATENLYIEWPLTNRKVSNVSLVDSRGRAVTARWQYQEIYLAVDLHGMAAGIYTVIINDGSNQHFARLIMR